MLQIASKPSGIGMFQNRYTTSAPRPQVPRAVKSVHILILWDSEQLHFEQLKRPWVLWRFLPRGCWSPADLARSPWVSLIIAHYQHGILKFSRPTVGIILDYIMETFSNRPTNWTTSQTPNQIGILNWGNKGVFFRHGYPRRVTKWPANVVHIWMLAFVLMYWSWYWEWYSNKVDCALSFLW